MSDASSFPDPPDRPARYSAQFTRQFASRQYRPLQHLIRTRLEVLFRDVYRAALSAHYGDIPEDFAF